MTTSDAGLDRVLGAKTAEALESALGLSTVGDLLRHYPRRYAERGELTAIAGLELDEHVTVLAKVERVSKRSMRTRRGATELFLALHRRQCEELLLDDGLNRGSHRVG